MTKNNRRFSDYPDSLSLSDVAELLGVSTRLASRLIRSGELFAVKVGREYRVAKTSVMEYLHDRRTPSPRRI